MAMEIAIVGMACRYPQACSPAELWENVLSQRRSFRRIPPERLHLEDYFSADRAVPDTTYSSAGAFIENYEFDRARFRISGNSYRASDLVHWLALDIASQALTDAGFTSHEQLPNVMTGVIVGNTLTGEFSRANGLRLRWPYVRRVLAQALIQEGWSSEHLQDFLYQLEDTYKAPFPPVAEDTLAGGLSNTIAGRICNYFNFKGGGYTIDGACSSSLLAVANACSALVSGDIDLALAGGVDLSMDPFELIGFAKTSALAQKEMRVFDVHSNGFLPGEGCGFVTLMRYEDAIAQQRRIYALIRGWGISSDGTGGITRPEVEGQMLALTRAYQRAHIGSETVAYFEGHGTGTPVGDATELQALTRLRRNAGASTPAVVGSIKANIGHTKAASGIAGLIKAVLAVSTQILPPNTGVYNPRPEFTDQDAVLQILESAKIWPEDLPLRAGVSSMGFGGINTHLVVEGIALQRRMALTTKERILSSSAQNAEILFLSALDRTEMLQKVTHLIEIAPRLALSELTDLTAHLAQTCRVGTVRAALVTSHPTELTEQLSKLGALLANSVTHYIDAQAGIFLVEGHHVPRIGFLFPGQGAPSYLSGGLLRRRFDFVDDLYSQLNFPAASNSTDTRIAQPAIITSSLAALRILHKIGITATVGIGHSLGELTALYWAGAMDESTLIHLAHMRGYAMSTLGNPTGTMVSLKATLEEVETLIEGEQVVIAGINAPQQIVIAGNNRSVDAVIEKATSRKIPTVSLAVSHAFHSPLIAEAVQPFSKHLAQADFHPLQRTVISTVTGTSLTKQVDIPELLCQQITSPVQFLPAVNQASPNIDLFIETGPGKILSGLVDQYSQIPSLPIDMGGDSIKGLLHVVGATFALGMPVHHEMLFAQRFYRSFDLNWQPHFFTNPCELLAHTHTILPQTARLSVEEPAFKPTQETLSPVMADTTSTEEFMKQLVAQRLELPASTLDSESRLLSDLHLNSITVGQIVSEAWRAFGLLPPITPTDYADATINEVVQAIEDLKSTGGTASLKEKMNVPAGVDTWVHAFEVVHVAVPLAEASTSDETGTWHIMSPDNYPHQDDLQYVLDRIPGEGVVVCLPPSLREQHIPLLLAAAQDFIQRSDTTHFVLIQHNSGGASFVRTLYLEAPKKTICVIDIPFGHSQTLAWVEAEVRAAQRGYTEAIYDANGQRTLPYLQILPIRAEMRIPLPLGSDDVLLVTGGGKGIAAECAFSLARTTGVRLLLVGRSKPSDDHVLTENLARIAAAGIVFHYVSADVADQETIKNALQSAEKKLGRITALLHGAGVNTPRLISILNTTNIDETLQPKVQGLRNVLAAIDPTQLKLLVSFGSVIARTGMRGEADYALANDWLAHLTEDFQANHPACRCLCIEWSVWAGVGMGERLGRVEALMREGIQPIPVDEGVALLHRLVEQRIPVVRVVVTSRWGNIPTLQMRSTDLPFLRFLEQPRVYYPGIELVVDAKLSITTDPYLEDHKYLGERLLPAVVGLEAMAQAAIAVTESNQIPHFSQVELYRPIVIPENGTTTIRIAALIREQGRVDIVLRSTDTGFQANHFSATCIFADQSASLVSLSLDLPEARKQKIELDPIHDLYGGILFHQGRFQRLLGYYLLTAKATIAEVNPYTGNSWYINYLPPDLVLGDPAARDAIIHCIQACIPHATLLPIGIESISLATDHLHSTQIRFVAAKERMRQGDVFHYDVEVSDENGDILEQWINLRLQQVANISGQNAWHSALLGPYMERKLQEFFASDAKLRLVLQHSLTQERHSQSEKALHGLLHTTSSVYRRPDGKPMLIERDAPTLSTAHAKDFTLAVTGAGPLGCDMEFIAPRSESTWRDLLGIERYHLATLLLSESDEDLDTIATRIWTASESLKKAGVNASLLFYGSREDGWYLFNAGLLAIATYKTTLQNIHDPVVLAVCLTREKH